MYQEKKLRQKERKEQEEIQLANVRKVNHTSEEIAARMGPTSERLLQKTGQVRPEIIKQIEEEQPTFQPSLPGLQDDNGIPRYGESIEIRNEKWLEAKAKRAKRTADTLRALEDAEWTFKPKVKSYQGQGRGTSYVQAEDRDPSEVVNRSMKWQKEKQRKLSAQRKEAKRAELEGYTFKPNLAKTFSTSPKQSPESKQINSGEPFSLNYDDPEDSDESEYGGTELDDNDDDEQQRGYEYTTSSRANSSQIDISIPFATRRASVQQSLEVGERDSRSDALRKRDSSTAASSVSAFCS